jgi:hypothetical protein
MAAVGLLAVDYLLDRIAWTEVVSGDSPLLLASKLEDHRTAPRGLVSRLWDSLLGILLVPRSGGGTADTRSAVGQILRPRSACGRLILSTTVRR